MQKNCCSLVSKFELQFANLCNLRIFASKFVVTFFTDLLFRFCKKKNDMHVRYTMMHVWNSDFVNINIGSCIFMQLAIICKYIYVHGFDWSTNTNLLKIDIHVRYTMLQV